MFARLRRVVLLGALFTAACSSGSSTVPAPGAEATPEPAMSHPLLGVPSRIELHHYRPERVATVSVPSEIAAIVGAIATTHESSAAMPRTMPWAEVTFHDATGEPIANAVFLSESDAGFINLRDRGTRELSAAEAAALRAALRGR